MPPPFRLKRADVPRDASGDDRSGLTECEGWMKKQSKRGFWQARYFVATNRYLSYYAGATAEVPLCAIDLSFCTAVEVIDSHTFEMQLAFSAGAAAKGRKGGADDDDDDDDDDDEILYSLRAPDGKALIMWEDVLQERVAWAKTPAARAKASGKAGASAAAAAAAVAGGKKKGGAATPAPVAAAGKKGKVAARGGESEEEEEEEEEDAGSSKRRKAAAAAAAAAKSKKPTAASGKRGAAADASDDDADDDDGAAAAAKAKQQRAASLQRGKQRGGDSEEEEGSGDEGGKGRGGGTALVKQRSAPRLGDVVGMAAAAAAASKRGGLGGAKGSAAPARGATRGGRGGGDDSDAEAQQGDGGSDEDVSPRGAPPAPLRGGLLGGKQGSASGTGLGARAAAVDSDDEGPVVVRGGAGASTAKNLAAARRREPSPVPSGPTMSGWVKKRARTKMGAWQLRFLRLEDGSLFFSDDADADADGDYSATMDVHALKDVKAGAGSSSADRKILVLDSEHSGEVQLRCNDEKAVSDWVAAIRSSIKQHSRHKNRSAAHGDNDNDSDNSGGEDDRGGDSDADSDASGGGRGGSLPPAPAWFAAYAKTGDEGKWMVATQKMLNKTFANIYEDDAGGGEAGIDGDGGGDRRVVITKLAEASSHSCTELEERVSECRMRGRGDIVKHLCQFSDLAFFQHLTPLTTGTAPSRLTSKQLLQLLDCIEGFTSVRKRALGGMTLSSQEARPSMMLRETRRALIDKYMAVMGPKLHDVVDKVLAKLRSEKGALVRRTLGTRVGTNSPTDIFNLMSEHLKIARDGGSVTLQRRLLSSVMAEVVYYAREVLTELMEWWQRSPLEVDMDYVTAVINDAGLMLDHIEQLEAYFAEALQKTDAETTATAAAASGRSSKGKAAAAAADADMDELDREEAQQAKEDLAAVEQDIPRAKGQLLASGCQLTGVLVDVIVEDFKVPLAAIFAASWERGGNFVTVITVTSHDYLSESRLLLDPFFSDRLSSMVLAHLTEAYMLRLLAPDAVKRATSPAVTGAKGPHARDKEFKGGFSSKFKLNEDRLKKLVADVVEMGNCFSQFMPREDLTYIMTSLNSVREMLTIDVDNLLTVLEVALRANASVSTHVFLAFERCLALREDMKAKEKKDVCDEALRLLHEFGEPPSVDDCDEILISTSGGGGGGGGGSGGHGGGVMHGASMSQGTGWAPINVTAAIYRSVFPNAGERAKVLFKGWTRPQRSVRNIVSSPASSGLGGGRRGDDDGEGGGGAALSLSSFAGGGAGGGGGKRGGGAAAEPETQSLDMSSFMGGGASKSGGGGSSKGLGSSKTRRTQVEEEEEAAPSRPSVPAASRRSGSGGSTMQSNGRRQAVAEEEEEAPPQRAPSSLTAPPPRAAGARPRRRRGEDDDE